MEEYKKSYTGFIVLMFLFIAIMTALALLPIEDNAIMITIMDNVSAISVAVLTYMIYKNEKIYWYSGVDYEVAKKATSRQRKEYAWRHFKRFGIFAVLYFLFSLIALVAKIPYSVGITTFVVGIAVVAISTIGIKLEDM